MRIILFLILSAFLMTGCQEKDQLADAYGNFEADDWLIYAESSGKLISFPVQEGLSVQKNQLIGQLDTTSLFLQKQQLLASISAIYAKKQTAGPDISLLQKKKEVLLGEKTRIANLLADNVATQKQMDDINNEISILDKQIVVAQEKVEIANKGLFAQVDPIRKQINIINYQLQKSKIYAPAGGTINQKYVNAGEMINPQIPLIKIANMDTLFLRAYFSGGQLANIKLNQEVNIRIDASQTYKGRITWISEKAEFTPKIVQTKEERTNLTYATKIAVANDSSLKIGMPGEVWLEGSEKSNNASSE